MSSPLTWPLPKYIGVKSLMLDPRNHRLPFEDGTDLGQRDLIGMLVEREDVLDLARKLVRSGGIITADSLVAIREKNKLVVLEGNRRLTALKLILDPSLAPPAFRTRFQKLATSVNLERFKQAPVVIAPSREMADSYILLRHAKLPVRQWDPVQQGRFFTSLLKNLPDASALAEEHNMRVADVRDAVRLFDLFRAAQFITLPKGTDSKILEPENFPSSTLERIFKTTEASNALGTSFDDNGRLLIHGDVDQFKERFAKIIGDCARPKTDPDYVDTRVLDKTEAVKNYIATRIAKSASKPLPAGTPIGVDDLASSQSSPTAPVAAPAPKPKAKKIAPQNSLVPRSWNLETTNDRITGVISELQSLDVSKRENAVAILVRTLVDLCFQVRLWQCPEWRSHVSKLQIKANKEADWHPSLRQMINFVCNATNGANKPIVAELKVSPAWVKAAGLLVSDKVIDQFDYYVHNPLYAPQKQNLVSAWKAIGSLLRGLFPPAN